MNTLKALIRCMNAQVSPDLCDVFIFSTCYSCANVHYCICIVTKILNVYLILSLGASSGASTVRSFEIGFISTYNVVIRIRSWA